MKLKVITGADSGKAVYSSIEFCGKQPNEGTALIQLKLAAGVVPTVKVDVTSNTSTSRSGMVSAVVKVTQPYVAMVDSGDGTYVADPGRSKQTMSAHVVLNLPAVMIQDLRGTSGTIAQAYAVKQLMGLLATFTAFTSYTYVPNGTAVVETDGGDPSSFTGVSSFVTEADCAAESEIPPSKTTIVPAWGDSVLDVSSDSLVVDLTNGPLARIVMGLPALSCADVFAPSGYKVQEV